METKADIYGDLIEPLVKQVTDFCEEYDIPMLLAVCLELNRKEDGKLDMSMAGSTHLTGLEVPGPMLIAAAILHVPGFENIDEFAEYKVA